MTMMIYSEICEAIPKCLHHAPIIRKRELEQKIVAMSMIQWAKNLAASNWKCTMNLNTISNNENMNVNSGMSSGVQATAYADGRAKARFLCRDTIGRLTKAP